jgi:hypothetical protein
MFAAIFTAPLFDVSIIYIESLKTPIRLAYFFGALLFLRWFLYMVKVKFYLIPGNRAIYFMFFFMVSVGVSAFMPSLYEHQIIVIPEVSEIGMLSEVSKNLLTPTLANLTQLLYPTYFLIFVVVVSTFLKAPQDFPIISRGWLYCGYAIIVSGVFHVLIARFGNSSLGDSYYRTFSGHGWPGYTSLDIGVLPRMYTLAGEPGYTSVFLLLVLSNLFADRYLDGNVHFNSKKYLLPNILIFSLSIVLVGGTTGAIGIIFASLVTPIVSAKIQGAELLNTTKRVLSNSILYVVAASLMAGFLAYFYSFEILYETFYQHLRKLIELEASGETRYYVNLHGFGVFLQAPIFGVGYGSNRSMAVSTFLLSNTGFVGTMLFIGVVFSALKLGFVNASSLVPHSAPTKYRAIYSGYLSSLITVFALMLFAKSESSLLFLYFWILILMLAKRNSFDESVLR